MQKSNLRLDLVPPIVLLLSRSASTGASGRLSLAESIASAGRTLRRRESASAGRGTTTTAGSSIGGAGELHTVIAA